MYFALASWNNNRQRNGVRGEGRDSEKRHSRHRNFVGPSPPLCRRTLLARVASAAPHTQSNDELAQLGTRAELRARQSRHSPPQPNGTLRAGGLVRRRLHEKHIVGVAKHPQRPLFLRLSHSLTLSLRLFSTPLQPSCTAARRTCVSQSVSFVQLLACVCGARLSSTFGSRSYEPTNQSFGPSWSEQMLVAKGNKLNSSFARPSGGGLQLVCARSISCASPPSIWRH